MDNTLQMDGSALFARVLGSLLQSPCRIPSLAYADIAADQHPLLVQRVVEASIMGFNVSNAFVG